MFWIKTNINSFRETGLGTSIEYKMIPGKMEDVFGKCTSKKTKKHTLCWPKKKKKKLKIRVTSPWSFFLHFNMDLIQLVNVMFCFVFSPTLGPWWRFNIGARPTHVGGLTFPSRCRNFIDGPSTLQLGLITYWWTAVPGTQLTANKQSWLIKAGIVFDP